MYYMEAQKNLISKDSHLSNLTKLILNQNKENTEQLKPVENSKPDEQKNIETPETKLENKSETIENTKNDYEDSISNNQPVDESNTISEKKEESNKPLDPEPTETKTFKINDDSVLEYLKSKTGKELKSLDELFNKTEVFSDPYEGLSEKTIQYLKYEKETKRSYSDFEKLNKDYTKLTPLEIAQQKAIDFSDGELTMLDVNEYLEKELGIDLSDISELDKFDSIKLKGYGKDYLKRQIEDQEKYKKPAEKKSNDNELKMLTLEDGTQISEEKYKILQNRHNQYLENIKKTSDNITNSTFQVKIDNNGNEKILELVYDLSKDDKHKMVSLSSDTNKALWTLFGTEKGELDYSKLQMGMLWADNSFREKAVNSIVHKALAQAAEDFFKLKNNINLTTSNMPKNNNGTKIVPIPTTKQINGVKYSIEQFK